MYKRALNDVKMVLYSEQFGHEVTSSHFCAVYNLGMKLVQVVLRSEQFGLEVRNARMALEIVHERAVV